MSLRMSLAAAMVLGLSATIAQAQEPALSANLPETPTT